MYNTTWKLLTLPTNEEMKHKYWTMTLTPPNELLCMHKSFSETSPQNPHPHHLWETKGRRFCSVHETALRFRSRGRRAFWTISWTVLLRRQTYDSSSSELRRAVPSEPAAKSERALIKLIRSASVMTVNGINEMVSFAHSRTLGPYILVKDSRT